MSRPVRLYTLLLNALRISLANLAGPVRARCVLNSLSLMTAGLRRAFGVDLMHRHRPGAINDHEVGTDLSPFGEKHHPGQLPGAVAPTP